MSPAATIIKGTTSLLLALVVEKLNNAHVRWNFFIPASLSPFSYPAASVSSILSEQTEFTQLHQLPNRLHTDIQLTDQCVISQGLYTGPYDLEKMYYLPKVQCWWKKSNSELRIFGAPPEGGGSTLNSQPPSKLIYLFQGAHMDQSCVSFDQHCTLLWAVTFLMFWAIDASAEMYMNCTCSQFESHLENQFWWVIKNDG